MYMEFWLALRNVYGVLLSTTSLPPAIELERHAEKILRDFLSPIDGDLQKTIYAELYGLTQEDAL